MAGRTVDRPASACAPRWESPATLAEAAEILRDAAGSARAIAGGTDLAVRIRRAEERPDVLVDLGRIENSDGVELRPEAGAIGRMEIGALATHATLAEHPLVREHANVLAEACRTVGAPQVRSRGTIGGNLANASPAADGVVALLALDAAVWVQSASSCAGDAGAVPIVDFLTGPGESVLRDDELIGGIVFDRPSPAARSVYVKAGQRNALAIAIASVAAIFEPDAGIVRIALGSVAPTPVRAGDAEALFESDWRGGADPETLFDAVAAAAAAASSPIDDVRATARYRRILTEALTRSALDRICLRKA